MNRVLHRDLIPAIGLFIFGSYALWEAREMSVFGAIFPQLAGGGLVLGALTLALRAVVLAPVTTPAKGTLLRPILMLASLFGWSVLLPVLGFIPTSLIGAGLCMLIAQQTKVPPKTLAFQFVGLVGLVLLMAIIFGQLLNVPLP